MSEPKKYVIVGFDDFSKIPADRLDDCLKEFFDFIRVYHSTVEIARSTVNTMSMVTGLPPEKFMVDGKLVSLGPFVWIDDGQKNASICIEIKNGEENE